MNWRLGTFLSAVESPLASLVVKIQEWIKKARFAGKNDHIIKSG